MKNNQTHSSWLAIWLGLAVGFLLYIINPLEYFNIDGDVYWWIYFLVVGFVVGLVCALTDRKNSFLAALTGGFIMFYLRYLSAVVQVRANAGLNVNYSDTLSIIWDSYLGVLIGALVAGLSVNLSQKKRKNV